MEMEEVKAHFKVLLQYLHEKIEENHEKPQGSWLSGQGMSLGTPRYVQE
jgi:hypothetical protein